MRSGAFRDAVGLMNWNPNDPRGATLEEFIRMDVRTRMEKCIAVAKTRALRVPARLTPDLVHADEPVGQARQAIERMSQLPGTGVRVIDRTSVAPSQS